VTVDNITGIGGMTRSGRLFAPAKLRIDKSHEKANEEVTMEIARNFLKGKTPQNNQVQEGNEKKEISNKEACEFLRFIQQSEYKVVHSTFQQKLLMKILNGAQVVRDISLYQFEGIISHITANDYLTFTEEEIPIEGRGHNKALHISVKCMDRVLARVLIDNGSSLNVMPKTTLHKLPCVELICVQAP